MTVPDAPTTLAAGPVPAGRGRWRLLVLNRSFSPSAWNTKIVTDLPDAFGRRLVRAWNTPAELSFSLDGKSAAAAMITELQSEVVAIRWDDTTGNDVPVFRGVVDHAEDVIDGSSHVTTFVAHDYLAMLGRRMIGQTATLSTGIDGIVDTLLQWGSSASVTVGNAALTPGSGLPVNRWNSNPDGTQRSYSSTTITRTWNAATNVLQAITDLSTSVPFDFDVVPTVGTQANGDVLRTFLPQQGVTKATPILEYGSTVATVQRQVDSADYANYWYVAGKSGAYGEQFNSDATGTVVGLWQSQSSNMSDIGDASQCWAQANGNINVHGLLVPSYTLGLAPNVWYLSRPSDYVYTAFANIGDVLTLLIKSGRLAVNTTVRVMGITYNIGDGGDENVELVVGRPRNELVSMLTAWQASVNALSRR